MSELLAGIVTLAVPFALIFIVAAAIIIARRRRRR